MTSREGESRRSSVRALNVRPQTPTVLPSTLPPAAATILAAVRSYCSTLTWITPDSRPKSYPASSAIFTNARVSFGKQLCATRPYDETTVPEAGTSTEYTSPENERRSVETTRTQHAFFSLGRYPVGAILFAW